MYYLGPSAPPLRFVVRRDVSGCRIAGVSNLRCASASHFGAEDERTDVMFGEPSALKAVWKVCSLIKCGCGTGLTMTASRF